MTPHFSGLSAELRACVADLGLQLDVPRGIYVSGAKERLADTLLLEELPVRVQVSSQFDQVALGVRWGDVVALSELTRAAGTPCAGPAEALSFWAEGGAVRTYRDGPWLLYSLEVTPDAGSIKSAIQHLNSIMYLAVLAVVTLAAGKS